TPRSPNTTAERANRTSPGTIRISQKSPDHARFRAARSVSRLLLPHAPAGATEPATARSSGRDGLDRGPVAARAPGAPRRRTGAGPVRLPDGPRAAPGGIPPAPGQAASLAVGRPGRPARGQTRRSESTP